MKRKVLCEAFIRRVVCVLKRGLVIQVFGAHAEEFAHGRPAADHRDEHRDDHQTAVQGSDEPQVQYDPVFGLPLVQVIYDAGEQDQGNGGADQRALPGG